VALSPQANYTDCAAATCRRNLVSTFVDRGVSRGQRGGSLTVVNLSSLDRRVWNELTCFSYRYSKQDTESCGVVDRFLEFSGQNLGSSAWINTKNYTFLTPG
jgi:hypothetical protein